MCAQASSHGCSRASTTITSWASSASIRARAGCHHRRRARAGVILNLGYRAAVAHDAAVERGAPCRRAPLHAAGRHGERAPAGFERAGVSGDRDAFGEPARDGDPGCGEPARKLAGGLHTVVGGSSRSHDRHDLLIEHSGEPLDPTAYAERARSECVFAQALRIGRAVRAHALHVLGCAHLGGLPFVVLHPQLCSAPTADRLDQLLIGQLQEAPEAREIAHPEVQRDAQPFEQPGASRALWADAAHAALRPERPDSGRSDRARERCLASTLSRRARSAIVRATRRARC